jgi:hypothetical protein
MQYQAWNKKTKVAKDHKEHPYKPVEYLPFVNLPKSRDQKAENCR